MGYSLLTSSRGMIYVNKTTPPSEQTASEGVESVTLEWDPVTGEPPIEGYYLKSGEASGVYTTSTLVGNVTEYTVYVPYGVTMFYAVSSYYTQEDVPVESALSNELSVTGKSGETTISLTAQILVPDKYKEGGSLAPQCIQLDVADTKTLYNLLHSMYYPPALLSADSTTSNRVPKLTQRR